MAARLWPREATFVRPTGGGVVVAAAGHACIICVRRPTLGAVYTGKGKQARAALSLQRQQENRAIVFFVSNLQVFGGLLLVTERIIFFSLSPSPPSLLSLLASRNFEVLFADAAPRCV